MSGAVLERAVSRVGFAGACAGLAVLLLAACMPPTADVRPADDDILLTSMQVHPAPDTVSFVLQVTNTSEAPVTLNFPTGQTYDFVVRHGGEQVWRWSDGQMFTQAVQQLVLDAGETLTRQASWPISDGTAGEYEAVGLLTAAENRVEQAARFRLP